MYVNIFLIGLQYDPVTLFIGVGADQIHKILTAADADSVAGYEEYHEEQYHCYRTGVTQIPVNKCFLVDIVYKYGC